MKKLEKVAADGIYIGVGKYHVNPIYYPTEIGRNLEITYKNQPL